MRRKNIQAILIVTLSIGTLIATGCKSGGFTMPEMPKMAFWKKDGLQWAKKDSVPPPATHFDPEPSMSGLSGSEAIADKKPKPADRFAENKPFEFPGSAIGMPSDRDDSSPANKAQEEPKQPIRTPYKYIESEDLNGTDDGAFQPGGQIKTKLPDLGAFNGFDATSNNSQPNDTSTFTPPNSKRPPTESKSGFTSSSNAFSPAGNFSNNNAMNDFAKKVEKELPGLPGQFKRSSSESPAPSKSGGAVQPGFPSFGASGKAGSFQNSAGSDLGTKQIKTPQRVELTPSNNLDKILTPNRQKSNGVQPNNQLRSSSSAGSSYPSTEFQGFPANNGLSPLRPTNNASQPARNLQPNFSNSSSGLGSSAKSPGDSGAFSPANGLTPTTPPNAKGSNPADDKGPDILLPAALRSADMSFAPGSVYKLMPNNQQPNESGKLIR